MHAQLWNVLCHVGTHPHAHPEMLAGFIAAAFGLILFFVVSGREDVQ